MELTKKELTEMLDKAEEAHACSDTIAELRRMIPEEVGSHQNAPYYAYWYARYVIGERWPEAEALIRTDHYSAYRYARHVIRSRWPEAEALIRIDPICAYLYAQDVIGGE